MISILFLWIFLSCCTGSATSQALQEAAHPKKERILGSAWQQAVMHVYIPSATEKDAPDKQNTIHQKNQAFPEHQSPQAPAPAQQKPEAVTYRPPVAQAPQPSPAEMQAFLSNLEAVFNSMDDDDDLFFYSDEDFDSDADFPAF